MNLLIVSVFHSLILIRQHCLCFPGDLKANLILTAKDTKLLSFFNGEKLPDDNVLRVLEVKNIDDAILVASLNQVYVFSSNSFAQTTGSIASDQLLDWIPNDTSLCETNSNMDCSNVIRSISIVSPGKVLLCGSNAGDPACRQYKWTGVNFLEKYDEIFLTKSNVFPLDNVNSFVYKVFGDYVETNKPESRELISAFGLETHLPPFIPNIVRTAISSNLPTFNEVLPDSSFKSLSIDAHARPAWLNDPHFVGMIETAEKIFIFFREEAIEATYESEKMVFSRVAQVCKNDIGGNEFVLNGKWTSFFKARLNCSTPGTRPFYFNEIQQVYGPIDYNGQMTVFAIFTTPEAALPGSAVCAFTMYDIASAMAGNFKEQKTLYWRNKIPNYPKPHPTNCKGNADKSSETLQFIREHSYMSEAVQPLGGRPMCVLTQTNTRFTSLAVEDNIENTEGLRVTVFYVGTHDGKLLKIVVDAEFPTTNRTAVLSEEWELYRPEICSTPNQSSSNNVAVSKQMKVNKVILVPHSDFVVASFQHCIISVPKKACWFYKCERSCINSGNPYCGWNSKYCVPVLPQNRIELQQDLFGRFSDSNVCERKYDIETELLDMPSQYQKCVFSNIIGYCLVGVLSATFAIILILLFLLCAQCNNRNTFSSCFEKQGHPNFRNKDLDNQNQQSVHFLSRQLSSSSRVNENIICDSTHRVKVGAANCEDVSYTTALNPPHDNYSKINSKKIQVVLNMTQGIHQSNSFDDTSWSEDAFESESSLPNLQQTAGNLVSQQAQDGSKDFIKPLGYSNNRAIGVAHPIKQSSVKLSQVVRPTFVQQPSSKLHGNAAARTNPYHNMENDHQPSTSRVLDHNQTFSNPSYVLMKPCAEIGSGFETKNQTCHKVAPVQSMTSFSPDQHLSPSQAVLNSTNEIFPPPPSCLTSSFQETKQTSSLKGSSEANTGVFIKSKLNENTSLLNNKVQYNERAASLLQSTTGKYESNMESDSNFLRNPQKRSVVPSASAESASSGFLSSSPQTSFTIPPLSSEKLQTLLEQNKELGCDEGMQASENIYDEVFEENAAFLDRDPYESINETASLCEEELNIAYPLPEFCYESDETEKEVAKNAAEVQLPSEKSKINKSKKSRKFFFSRKHKKSNKSEIKEPQTQNEESFFSPSYDEEPIVPVVEGWQEIEYNPAPFFNQDDKTIRSVDDSDIMSNTSRQKEQGFFTMRPKNHQRQRLPKLRSTDKEWIGNNPMPVPSPAIPTKK